MLMLKIIWSGFAVAGIGISLFEGAARFAWIFLGVFAAFSVVWWRYWLLLRPSRPLLEQ